MGADTENSTNEQRGWATPWASRARHHGEQRSTTHDMEASSSGRQRAWGIWCDRGSSKPARGRGRAGREAARRGSCRRGHRHGWAGAEKTLASSKATARLEIQRAGVRRRGELHGEEAEGGVSRPGRWAGVSSAGRLPWQRQRDFGEQRSTQGRRVGAGRAMEMGAELEEQGARGDGGRARQGEATAATIGNEPELRALENHQTEDDNLETLDLCASFSRLQASTGGEWSVAEPAQPRDLGSQLRRGVRVHPPGSYRRR
jgi:hypothetical protein